MSKFSDYITSLEGKENIDPLVVAATLSELHNEEMGLVDSKVASLESTIAEKDVSITDLNTTLRDQKAKNWDLANRVPAGNKDADAENTDSQINASEATFDDFFKEE